MAPVRGPGKRRRIVRWTALLGVFVVAALVVAACGGVSPPSDPPPATVTPSDPPATAAVASPSPSFTAGELAEWIAFREAYGLRADEAWIRQVAADPASRNDTDIPLLPFELDALGRAVVSLDGLIAALQAYGRAIPGVFGGVVVDGKDAVILVTDDPDTHRKVLAAILPSLERIQVRSVRWSLADLKAKAAAIEARPEVLEALGARLIHAGVDMSENVVDVRYQGPGPGSEAAIRTALGGADWLHVEWRGPLPWTGPRGTLHIRAVDAQGRPVVGALCELRPVDPAVNADDAISYSTDDQGRCPMDGYPAVRYIVTLTKRLPDGSRVTASAPAVIPAGRTSEVEVVFEP